MTPPTNIRVHRDAGELELCWPGGSTQRLEFRFLRGRCPCADCVDEFTGVRRVDVEDVPETVQPQDIGFSGNYALKIVWSDGHSSGLYTWDYLAGL